jgi:hypothetical protein
MIACLLFYAAAAVNTGSAPPASPAGQTASRGLVIVLMPPAEDEVTRNAIARINGELAAAPFEVVAAPFDPAADVMVQVENASRDLAPVAAFAIVREGGDRPGTVAVWVSNRITETTNVHRVSVRGGDPDGAAAHLAVEAVEFVRASLAGLWPTPAKEPAPEVTPPPPPPPSPHLAVGVGVGVFRDLRTAPVFWEPTLIASYELANQLGLRLSLVGLGPGAEVDTTAGPGVRLQRAAASIGLVRGFRAGSTLRPLLGAALGAHYLAAEGMGASVATREHDVSSWSALATVGGGCAIALTSHVALRAEVEGMLIWPTVRVLVDAVDVYRIDRPTLLTDVGLLAIF